MLACVNRSFGPPTAANNVKQKKPLPMLPECAYIVKKEIGFRPKLVILYAWLDFSNSFSVLTAFLYRTAIK